MTPAALLAQVADRLSRAGIPDPQSDARRLVAHALGIAPERVRLSDREASDAELRALDAAIEYTKDRKQFGKSISDFQAVQFMLADCASELYIGRLMLLHIAYKAEKGLDIRQENSIAKIFYAHMLHKVIDTAIQLHGALGFSQDTPLAKWYTQVRSQRLVDGPDEVHKWKIGKNVIKAFREHGTTASAAGGDLL